MGSLCKAKLDKAIFVVHDSEYQNILEFQSKPILMNSVLYFQNEPASNLLIQILESMDIHKWNQNQFRHWNCCEAHLLIFWNHVMIVVVFWNQSWVSLWFFYQHLCMVYKSVEFSILISILLYQYIAINNLILVLI